MGNLMIEKQKVQNYKINHTIIQYIIIYIIHVTYTYIPSVS